MSELRLNLGCGAKRLDGYLNVDKYGNPDPRFDLETFPWPWNDNSVAEIELHHVLEHLGQQTDVYLKIIQEMYRVCAPGAKVHVVVPHHRHDNFLHDPTHVRAITPVGLSLFSQRLNREWQANGKAFGSIPLRAKIHPQAGSLGLDKQSLPTQANIKSAQADFVRVAATLVVRCFNKIGMLPSFQSTWSVSRC